MNTTIHYKNASSPQEVSGMNTKELRDNFIADNLFEAEKINWHYTFYDRFMAGGAMPVDTAMPLMNPPSLKANFFLERRELATINIGGAGSITVDGEIFELQNKEALYIGKGSKEVIFKSDSKLNPAKFYLNAAVAHHTYPTKKVKENAAAKVSIGTAANCNQRTITKYIVAPAVQTCQVQMGLTQIHTGSVWNTMPPHTHHRRMEVYFYFDMLEAQSVCHFMGEPQHTRNVWLGNEQAIISPPWSVHFGVGTASYSFIWGMAGENLDYDDMEPCAINQLQ